MPSPDAAPAPESTGSWEQPWHALPPEAALQQLHTSAHGLAPEEAARRLDQWGLNQLSPVPPTPAWRRFLRQFDNLLIYVLIASATVTAALGHGVDTGVILLVILANGLIGFLQEGKAEQALAAIRAMIAPQATVLRDRHRQTIEAAHIAPGDLVLLEAGDRVPADLRLLRVNRLRIDEAILTGESVPVDKQTEAVAPTAAAADQLDMAFSGTLVVAGMGVGIAVATGHRTQIGHISTLLQRVENLQTPLLRQMNQLGRQLTWVILVISMAIFGMALLRGMPWDEAFMVVVGLAVAAIPEGLPAVMSIALAIGVRRMAARQAIVRRMPAVETLGAVSVICTDKTGTLTRNEMMVSRVVTTAREIGVSGEGYAPVGAFDCAGTPIDPAQDDLLTQAALAALLCNDAAVLEHGDGWHVSGDPMEGALLCLAQKAGLDPKTLRDAHPRLAEFPFDSRHQYMATLHAAGDGASMLYVKGAPERVLDLCAWEMAPAGVRAISKAFWLERIDDLAASGHRVLALAQRRFAEPPTALHAEHREQELVLLALLGLQDPPRAEAITAIAECQAAGIRVKMITGDHVGTAVAIARQLGLVDAGAVLAGAQLEALDEAALREAAQRTSVFARTTPEHKLRLVTALQAGGAIVAMTGDGVNDAPALKRADVGVAMGRKGTEVAKEAAAMVLVDDNFASIVAAVKEGRTVYDNLRKVLAWTLPTNGGESLAIIAAIALGLTLPITPLQILWINTLTAVGLGLILAFEPAEPDLMRRAPRPAGAALLSGYLLWRVSLLAVLIAAGSFAALALAQAHGASLEQARTMAVNVMVVMEIFYLFNVRYLNRASMTLRGLLGTPAVLIGVSGVTVMQLLFTYAPPLQRLFDTRPLSAEQVLWVIGFGIALFVVLEMEKFVARRLFPGIIHPAAPAHLNHKETKP
ncbi:MAG TPA: HAD-IC family P-type ATPase [Candidatus Macondimonas sp.]|nr:HAD-IC family P-type ATPase [Candidatus Macondimonas sp.]